MASCYKTFISVGNAKQHFSRLLNVIESLVDQLPRPILIQAGHTPINSKHCDVVDFIAMDTFTQYMHDAELLILHAGAGSLLHAIKANKFPIVVPRRASFNEHVNDHQFAFAKMLDLEGRAFCVEDPNDLATAIQILQQKKSLAKEQYPSRAMDVIDHLLINLFAKTSKQTG